MRMDAGIVLLWTRGASSWVIAGAGRRAAIRASLMRIGGGYSVPSRLPTCPPARSRRPARSGPRRSGGSDLPHGLRFTYRRHNGPVGALARSSGAESVAPHARAHCPALFALETRQRYLEAGSLPVWRNVSVGSLRNAPPPASRGDPLPGCQWKRPGRPNAYRNMATTFGFGATIPRRSA